VDSPSCILGIILNTDVIHKQFTCNEQISSSFVKPQEYEAKDKNKQKKMRNKVPLYYGHVQIGSQHVQLLVTFHKHHNGD
jgi:hypothetical protein